ncbi:MAG: hypothetical protein ACAI38_06950 [Myxococcota bacterium]|nr:hypothetical protein [Myxococcota bacterium]
MTNRITPQAAYAAAIAPGSEQRHRISDTEFGRIAEAFNRRSHAVDFMGIKAFDQTQAAQTTFLRSIADENPALAQSLLRGENWQQYLGRRIGHDVRPESAEQARAELRTRLGGSSDAMPPRVPDALRQRVERFGAQVRASTNEVLNPTDGKYFELFRGNLEAAYRSPEGRALLEEVGKVPGVTNARQTMSEIIGRSRDR